MYKLTALLLSVILLTVSVCACGAKKTAEAPENDVSATQPQETEPPVDPALPATPFDIRCRTADGYTMDQHNEMTKTDYRAAVKYYLENGYSEYSVMEVGGVLSTTLACDLNYRVVTFNTNQKELYLGVSADGAILPEKVTLGEKICDFTVTQKKSNEINGMGYIIRLEDGSFIVVDGGYMQDASLLYDAICELNGSKDGIHIRAWLITHSHDDHCQAFGKFAKDYGDSVKLDYFITSPIAYSVSNPPYLTNDYKDDLKKFDGAIFSGAHTGTVFTFGDLKIEILFGPEQNYKKDPPSDSNESSMVFRVANKDGSMIFLGDCGVRTCDWMVNSYGEALKSDMVQISHHGCETATAELYDMIAAETCFWPCSESLMASYRGELVKQHIIEAEYSKEHLLHSYGNVTRPLSYKAKDPNYLDILPKSAKGISASAYAKNVRVENGVLKFDTISIKNQFDPYISFVLDNVDTAEYNAVRIVAKSETCGESSAVFFTSGNDTALKFSSNKSSALGVMGASDDGTTTYIAYLADIKGGYTGRLSSIRFDFGAKSGQTVEIYSIELFYLDVN